MLKKRLGVEGGGRRRRCVKEKTRNQGLEGGGRRETMCIKRYVTRTGRKEGGG